MSKLFLSLSLVPLGLALAACGGTPGPRSTATAPPATAPPPVVSSVPAVLTYHNNSQRTGQNTNETVLTPANVNAAQFGKLFSYSVDGQVYAQPLYMPGLQIAGGQHNVVFVATQNDSVYAFDADGIAPTQLWHITLGRPAAESGDIAPLKGITATPVIDKSTATMYVVAFNSDSQFRLHALDISTGAEKFGGPVIISAAVNGTATDAVNGVITLNAACYQRTGLLLANGRVYFGFGHCAHGWLLAYDAQTLAQVAVFNNTPEATIIPGTTNGGIWMSGDGAAADDAGNLYVLTGNGDFNVYSGGTDYGDTVLKLSPSLTVLDYFAPFNALYLGPNDVDLGSGGPALLTDNGSSQIVGGGKYGRLYLLTTASLGGYSATGNDSNAWQFIPGLRDGVTNGTHSIYCTPAYWNGMVFLQPQNDVLRAFAWNGRLSSAPVATSSQTFGDHGATPSISANGNSNAIVWVLQVDHWSTGGPAVLHAYDALNVAHELYSSSQAGSRDTAGPAVKFAVPTVVNGRVYVGAANVLDVYGLLSP